MMKFNADFLYLQWPAVKALAANDLSRIIGLVPLAGYLILMNDEIARFASFDAIAGVEAGGASPFTLSGIVKLRLIFFGSLLVFFSYVLFKLFRPRELDNSRDEVEFSTRVINEYVVQEIGNIEIRIYSDGWIPRTDTFWMVRGDRRSTKARVAGYYPQARDSMMENYRDYIQLLAVEWWCGMMHKSPTARYISMFCGVMGYSLLALPTLDIAQAVLFDLASDLFK